MTSIRPREQFHKMIDFFQINLVYNIYGKMNTWEDDYHLSVAEEVIT